MSKWHDLMLTVDRDGLSRRFSGTYRNRLILFHTLATTPVCFLAIARLSRHHRLTSPRGHVPDIGLGTVQLGRVTDWSYLPCHHHHLLDWVEWWAGWWREVTARPLCRDRTNRCEAPVWHTERGIWVSPTILGLNSLMLCGGSVGEGVTL
jgi:hypothetical protein